MEARHNVSQLCAKQLPAPGTVKHQAADIPFLESLENRQVRRALGMSKEDERSCYELLKLQLKR
jgi:hypothetical protein